MNEIFKLFGTIAVDNDEANKGIDETTEKAENAGEKTGSAFEKIGNAALKVGKVVGVGMIAAATAVSGLTKAAVEDYAEYEQLVGGVETLFKDSSDKVVKYAANAYKTAGLSANEYMETVTSFSASLLQSLDGDTAAAAEKANLAITDMSDNANKMGTSMESIQNAYQGFAKQNYTMLDNLKLGYGGTKEEMQRLLEDATALSGIQYDISSYADIVDAIHVIQTDLDITGTTAKEASTTIQGSFNSMKASWTNFLTGMADETQDFDALLGNLIDSVVTFADNLVPRIAMTLPRLVDGLVQVVQSLASYLPGIIEQLLPALITGATALITGIVDVLPSLVDVIIQQFPLLFDGVMQIIVALVNALPTIIQTLLDAIPDIMVSLVEAITNNLPALIKGCIALVLGLVKAAPKIISALIDALPMMIEMIVQALIECLPELIVGCVQLVIGLAKAYPQIIMALIAVVPKIMGAIVTALGKAFPQVIKWVTSSLNSIKENISNVFDNIKNIATKTWNAVKDAITNPIESAKNTIKAIVDTIKGIFSGLKISFPNIALPHFKITPKGWEIGDLLKGKIPSLGIDWYAKAMDNPMIMTRPTAFGMNANGQIMAGGEKGSEVVSGTNTLMGMISQAVATQNGDLLVVQTKILEAILSLDDNMGGNMREALAGTSFQVNNREFARLVKAVN